MRILAIAFVGCLVGCVGVTRGSTTPSGDQTATADPDDPGNQNLPNDPSSTCGDGNGFRLKADGPCIPRARSTP